MDNDAIFSSMFAHRAFNNPWTTASESFAATHGIIVDNPPEISLRRFFSVNQKLMVPAIQTTDAFIFIQDMSENTCYRLSIDAARKLYNEMISHW